MNSLYLQAWQDSDGQVWLRDTETHRLLFKATPECSELASAWDFAEKLIGPFTEFQIDENKKLRECWFPVSYVSRGDIIDMKGGELTDADKVNALDDSDMYYIAEHIWTDSMAEDYYMALEYVIENYFSEILAKENKVVRFSFDDKDNENVD